MGDFGFSVGCSAQEVVHRCPIEVCEGDKNGCWDITQSSFVLRVATLGTVKDVRNILLGEFVFEPKFSQSSESHRNFNGGNPLL